MIYGPCDYCGDSDFLVIVPRGGDELNYYCHKCVENGDAE